MIRLRRALVRLRPGARARGLKRERTRHEQHNASHRVLVHGGFVDGSGWEGVYTIMREGGCNVSVVQNPTTSRADDVAASTRILGAQGGPAILVGHSYGGVVITEAGTDPSVAGLVYIAEFAPDAGESVASLIKDPARGAPIPPMMPPRDGGRRADPEGRRQCGRGSPAGMTIRSSTMLRGL